MAAARRLAWAKFFNAGQSCVAPDYVLCTPQMQADLIPALRETLEIFYTTEPQKSPDIGRIVTDRHWSRLIEMLKKSAGKVVIGGGERRAGEIHCPYGAGGRPGERCAYGRRDLRPPFYPSSPFRPSRKGSTS
ncbi:hypothetical protein SKAU_G00300160 [Synaphobranchus kaupii]|uniref:Aldehyde dehydrogenase domain-containing protein n=1 Tax=Synaphobranchus kaupii TaxID=118154 RepID=A0A9Q1IN63_SYNKA|nr:hypothetical protein SKAU_G00300160 [Synaphobranchus kaupii]